MLQGGCGLCVAAKAVAQVLGVAPATANAGRLLPGPRRQQQLAAAAAAATEVAAAAAASNKQHVRSFGT